MTDPRHRAVRGQGLPAVRHEGTLADISVSGRRQRLAGASERLAEAVAWGETAADRFLPRQPVHGFWDNNVFCHGERLVHVADFDFMAERARIDDLALTLYFADHEFGQTRTIGSQPCGHSWRRTTVASSAE